MSGQKKDAKDIKKDIMKEIETYLHTYAVTYCKEAEIELTATAKYAIQQFYKDYIPEEYVRTKNLLKRSYEPYYHDNGRQVYGGVRISADNMFENYDGVDAAYVVNAGWHGWHGMMGNDDMDNWSNVNNFGLIYTTPPLDILREIMQDKSFLRSLDKKARAAAGKKSYEYLSKFFKLT